MADLSPVPSSSDEDYEMIDDRTESGASNEDNEVYYDCEDIMFKPEGGEISDMKSKTSKINLNISEENAEKKERKSMEEELAAVKEALDLEKEESRQLQMKHTELSANFSLKSEQVARLENAYEKFKSEVQKNVTKHLVDHNDASHCTRTVTFAKGENDIFGLSIKGIFVADVAKGEPAEMNGVRRGDQVVSIDGVNVDQLSSENIGNLFKTANLSGSITLVLYYNPERLRDLEAPWMAVGTAPNQLDYATDENANLKGALREMTTQIEQVLEGGPAHTNGVRRGDQILSIDGVRADSLHINDLFSMSKENGRITLVIWSNPESLRDLEYAQNQCGEFARKNAELKYMMTNLSVNVAALKSSRDNEDSTIRTVTITKEETGVFGLSNISTSISAVIERGPAQIKGVRRGDQILSIDGVSLDSLSNELISVLFGKAIVMGKMKLELRYNPERLKDLERRYNFV